MLFQLQYLIQREPFLSEVVDSLCLVERGHVPQDLLHIVEQVDPAVGAVELLRLHRPQRPHLWEVCLSRLLTKLSFKKAKNKSRYLCSPFVLQVTTTSRPTKVNGWISKHMVGNQPIQVRFPTAS